MTPLVTTSSHADPSVKGARYSHCPSTEGTKTVSMASNRAHDVASSIDRPAAVRQLAEGTLAATLSPPEFGQPPHASSSAIIQQHLKAAVPGSQGAPAPAPAGPAAHATPPAAAVATPGTALSHTHDTSSSGATTSATTAAAAQPHTQATPSAATGAQLANAPTGQGPLVTSSAEEGAQAQEVLRLLDNYDFRIYGQGLMAGADAVPLTPPNHAVLYKPTPEETVEAPLPPAVAQELQQQQEQQQQQQQQQQPLRSNQTHTAGHNSSSHSSSSSTPADSTTVGPTVNAGATTFAAPVGGTPTTSGSTHDQLATQPPAQAARVAATKTPASAATVGPAVTQSSNSSSSSNTGRGTSKLQGALKAAAAAALPPCGATAASIAAKEPAATPVSSPVSSTTKVVLLNQDLQQQQQGQREQAPAGSPAIGSTSPGSSSAAATAGPQRTSLAGSGGSTVGSGGGNAGSGSSSGSSSGGIIANIKGAVSGAWDSSKAKAQRLGNWLLDELIYAAWVVLQWLAWLLLTPLKAVFGPWYNYNRRLKEQSAAHLSAPFDIAKLQELLGALPSWLVGIGGSTEELGWLNTLLAQVWPTLDPVVCELVRTTIEPLLDDMKPPIIAKMGFQRLTLGELPVVLDGIRLVGTGDKTDVCGDAAVEAAASRYQRSQEAARSDDRLEVEVDFHWVGEPNISFFVELAFAGPYTRLVPKVSNLTAQGTMRLGLTRLVPQLPGFGALMVSFARVPQIKFTLDFGPALGGKVTAKPVANFLDPFLRDTLASLLVWPNRFVVPLLPRNVTGNLDSLALHSVGVLEVEVLSASELPKKGGFMSTIDPQVELWTQPQHRVHSAVKRHKRNPKWQGQRLEVLIQEPDSQLLRVVMHDIDMLNVQELFRLNVVKGATNLLRSANPIGFAALPLRDICAQAFQRQELELRLAGSEWAQELGVVGEDSAGMLRLAVTYKPFQDLDADGDGLINARGALFVTVRQCQELPSGDWNNGDSDPYVRLQVGGQKQQTAVMPHTRSPIYNSHHEFFNVQLPDVLKVQVYDRDFLKPDDLLGQVELPVKTIITWTQGGVRGTRDGWWRLKQKKSESWDKAQGGRIEMKVQFRPYST